MPVDPPRDLPAATAPVAEKEGVGQTAIREAVEQLRASLPKLQETSPAFANGLRELLQRADDPVRLNQAEFQHRIAYAVQDARSQIGPIAFSSPEHLRYVRDLSTSAPGLVNERLASLMEGLQAAPDVALRTEVRRAALEIGKQADQNTPVIQSQIDALENRFRLASRVDAAAADANPASRPLPLAAGIDRAGGVSRSDRESPQSTGRAQESATPGGGLNMTSAPGRDPFSQQMQVGAGVAIGSALLRGFQRLGEAIPPPPWDTMTTHFGDRLKSYEAGQAARADQKAISSVEDSGRRAISALQSFSNNEGAVMLNRINQAARSDPNGIEGVMADMKPGGKYSALRQQFNAAISDEKGFSAAYDKALEAVSAYGMERAGARTNIGRAPDSVAITTKLEAIEQNIGERMSAIPSRSDGRAMMDDLRQQAAEIFKAVAEGLKNLFQRATAGASPSPSA